MNGRPVSVINKAKRGTRRWMGLEDRVNGESSVGENTTSNRGEYVRGPEGRHD